MTPTFRARFASQVRATLPRRLALAWCAAAPAPAAASTYFLAIELNGTAAGTGYDQIDVTGNVLIGQAVLNVSLAFTSPPGAEFMIVKNDSVDAVGS